MADEYSEKEQKREAGIRPWVRNVATGVFVTVVGGVILAVILGDFPHREPTEEEVEPPAVTEEVAAKPTEAAEQPTAVPPADSVPDEEATPDPLAGGLILEPCGADLCITEHGGGRTYLGLAPTYVGFEQPSWAPDGSRFAFDGCKSSELSSGSDCLPNLYLADPDGSNVAVLFSDTSVWAHYPTWSPDGEWIAGDIDGSLAAIRPDGSEVRTLLAKVCPASVAWSPDSRRIAWMAAPCPNPGPPSTVWVVDADGGNLRMIFPLEEPLRAGQIGWDPSGQFVAVGLESGVSYLVDANCPNQPNGCDESSRTVIAGVPEHWRHNFFPQWMGEDVTK